MYILSNITCIINTIVLILITIILIVVIIDNYKNVNKTENFTSELSTNIKDIYKDIKNKRDEDRSYIDKINKIKINNKYNYTITDFLNFFNNDLSIKNILNTIKSKNKDNIYNDINFIDENLLDEYFKSFRYFDTDIDFSSIKHSKLFKDYYDYVYNKYKDKNLLNKSNFDYYNTIYKHSNIKEFIDFIKNNKDINYLQKNIDELNESIIKDLNLASEVSKDFINYLEYNKDSNKTIKDYIKESSTGKSFIDYINYNYYDNKITDEKILNILYNLIIPNNYLIDFMEWNNIENYIDNIYQLLLYSNTANKNLLSDINYILDTIKENKKNYRLYEIANYIYSIRNILPEKNYIYNNIINSNEFINNRNIILDTPEFMSNPSMYIENLDIDNLNKSNNNIVNSEDEEILGYLFSDIYSFMTLNNPSSYLYNRFLNRIIFADNLYKPEKLNSLNNKLFNLYNSNNIDDILLADFYLSLIDKEFIDYDKDGNIIKKDFQKIETNEEMKYILDNLNPYNYLNYIFNNLYYIIKEKELFDKYIYKPSIEKYKELSNKFNLIDKLNRFIKDNKLSLNSDDLKNSVYYKEYKDYIKSINPYLSNITNEDILDKIINEHIYLWNQYYRILINNYKIEIEKDIIDKNYYDNLKDIFNSYFIDNNIIGNFELENNLDNIISKSYNIAKDLNPSINELEFKRNINNLLTESKYGSNNLYIYKKLLYERPPLFIDISGYSPRPLPDIPNDPFGPLIPIIPDDTKLTIDNIKSIKFIFDKIFYNINNVLNNNKEFIDKYKLFLYSPDNYSIIDSIIKTYKYFNSSYNNVLEYRFNNDKQNIYMNFIIENFIDDFSNNSFYKWYILSIEDIMKYININENIDKSYITEFLYYFNNFFSYINTISIHYTDTLSLKEYYEMIESSNDNNDSKFKISIDELLKFLNINNISDLNNIFFPIYYIKDDNNKIEEIFKSKLWNYDIIENLLNTYQFKEYNKINFKQLINNDIDISDNTLDKYNIKELTNIYNIRSITSKFILPEIFNIINIIKKININSLIITTDIKKIDNNKIIEIDNTVKLSDVINVINNGNKEQYLDNNNISYNFIQDSVITNFLDLMKYIKVKNLEVNLDSYIFIIFDKIYEAILEINKYNSNVPLKDFIQTSETFNKLLIFLNSTNKQNIVFNIDELYNIIYTFIYMSPYQILEINEMIKDINDPIRQVINPGYVDKSKFIYADIYVYYNLLFKDIPIINMEDLVINYKIKIIDSDLYRFINQLKNHNSEIYKELILSSISNKDIFSSYILIYRYYNLDDIDFVTNQDYAHTDTTDNYNKIKSYFKSLYDENIDKNTKMWNIYMYSNLNGFIDYIIKENLDLSFIDKNNETIKFIEYISKLFDTIISEDSYNYMDISTYLSILSKEYIDINLDKLNNYIKSYIDINLSQWNYDTFNNSIDILQQQLYKISNNKIYYLLDTNFEKKKLDELLNDKSLYSFIININNIINYRSKYLLKEIEYYMYNNIDDIDITNYEYKKSLNKITMDINDILINNLTIDDCINQINNKENKISSIDEIYPYKSYSFITNNNIKSFMDVANLIYDVYSIYGNNNYDIEQFSDGCISPMNFITSYYNYLYPFDIRNQFINLEKNKDIAKYTSEELKEYLSNVLDNNNSPNIIDLLLYICKNNTNNLQYYDTVTINRKVIDLILLKKFQIEMFLEKENIDTKLIDIMDKDKVIELYKLLFIDPKICVYLDSNIKNNTRYFYFKKDSTFGSPYIFAEIYYYYNLLGGDENLEIEYNNSILNTTLKSLFKTYDYKNCTDKIYEPYIKLPCSENSKLNYYSGNLYQVISYILNNINLYKSSIFPYITEDLIKQFNLYRIYDPIYCKEYIEDIENNNIEDKNNIIKNYIKITFIDKKSDKTKNKDNEFLYYNNLNYDIYSNLKFSEFMKYVLDNYDTYRKNKFDKIKSYKDMIMIITNEYLENKNNTLKFLLDKYNLNKNKFEEFLNLSLESPYDLNKKYEDKIKILWSIDTLDNYTIDENYINQIIKYKLPEYKAYIYTYSDLELPVYKNSSIDKYNINVIDKNKTIKDIQKILIDNKLNKSLISLIEDNTFIWSKGNENLAINNIYQFYKLFKNEIDLYPKKLKEFIINVSDFILSIINITDIDKLNLSIDSYIDQIKNDKFFNYIQSLDKSLDKSDESKIKEFIISLLELSPYDIYLYNNKIFVNKYLYPAEIMLYYDLIYKDDNENEDYDFDKIKIYKNKILNSNFFKYFSSIFDIENNNFKVFNSDDLNILYNDTVYLNIISNEENKNILEEYRNIIIYDPTYINKYRDINFINTLEKNYPYIYNLYLSAKNLYTDINDIAYYIFANSNIVDFINSSQYNYIDKKFYISDNSSLENINLINIYNRLLYILELNDELYIDDIFNDEEKNNLLKLIDLINENTEFIKLDFDLNNIKYISNAIFISKDNKYYKCMIIEELLKWYVIFNYIKKSDIDNLIIDMDDNSTSYLYTENYEVKNIFKYEPAKININESIKSLFDNYIGNIIYDIKLHNFIDVNNNADNIYKLTLDIDEKNNLIGGKNIYDTIYTIKKINYPINKQIKLFTDLILGLFKEMYNYYNNNISLLEYCSNLNNKPYLKKFKSIFGSISSETLASYVFILFALSPIDIEYIYGISMDKYGHKYLGDPNEIISYYSLFFNDTNEPKLDNTISDKITLDDFNNIVNSEKSDFYILSDNMTLKEYYNSPDNINYNFLEIYDNSYNNLISFTSVYNFLSYLSIFSENKTSIDNIPYILNNIIREKNNINNVNTIINNSNLTLTDMNILSENGYNYIIVYLFINNFDKNMRNYFVSTDREYNFSNIKYYILDITDKKISNKISDILINIYNRADLDNIDFNNVRPIELFDYIDEPNYPEYNKYYKIISLLYKFINTLIMDYNNSNKMFGNENFYNVLSQFFKSSPTLDNFISLYKNTYDVLEELKTAYNISTYGTDLYENILYYLIVYLINEINLNNKEINTIDNNLNTLLNQTENKLSGIYDLNTIFNNENNKNSIHVIIDDILETYNINIFDENLDIFKYSSYKDIVNNVQNIYGNNRDILMNLLNIIYGLFNNNSVFPELEYFNFYFKNMIKELDDTKTNNQIKTEVKKSNFYKLLNNVFDINNNNFISIDKNTDINSISNNSSIWISIVGINYNKINSAGNEGNDWRFKDYQDIILYDPAYSDRFREKSYIDMLYKNHRYIYNLVEEYLNNPSINNGNIKANDIAYYVFANSNVIEYIKYQIMNENKKYYIADKKHNNVIIDNYRIIYNYMQLNNSIDLNIYYSDEERNNLFNIIKIIIRKYNNIVKNAIVNPEEATNAIILDYDQTFYDIANLDDLINWNIIFNIYNSKSILNKIDKLNIIVNEIYDLNSKLELKKNYKYYPKKLDIDADTYSMFYITDNILDNTYNNIFKHLFVNVRGNKYYDPKANSYAKVYINYGPNKNTYVGYTNLKHYYDGNINEFSNISDGSIESYFKRFIKLIADVLYEINDIYTNYNTGKLKSNNLQEFVNNVINAYNNNSSNEDKKIISLTKNINKLFTLIRNYNKQFGKNVTNELLAFYIYLISSLNPLDLFYGYDIDKEENYLDYYYPFHEYVPNEALVYYYLLFPNQYSTNLIEGI